MKLPVLLLVSLLLINFEIPQFLHISRAKYWFQTAQISLIFVAVLSFKMYQALQMSQKALGTEATCRATQEAAILLSFSSCCGVVSCFQANYGGRRRCWHRFVRRWIRRWWTSKFLQIFVKGRVVFRYFINWKLIDTEIYLYPTVTDISYCCYAILGKNCGFNEALLSKWHTLQYLKVFL